MALWGDLDQPAALRHLDRALERAESLEDLGLEARISVRLVQANRGQLDERWERLSSRAVAIGERVRGRLGHVLLAEVGACEGLRGQWQVARDLLSRSAAMSRKYSTAVNAFVARLDWLAGAAVADLWPVLEDYLPAQGETLHGGVLFLGILVA